MQRKLLLLAITVFGIAMAYSQDASTLWRKVPSTSRTINDTDTPSVQLYRLDHTAFINIVATATGRNASATTAQVSIPAFSGKMEKYSMEEYSNFSPELQAKYKEIRAYKGKGVTDKSALLFLSVSPNGIQTMVLRAGKNTEYVEAYDKQAGIYRVFDAATSSKLSQLNCATKDVAIAKDLAGKGISLYSSERKLRTFKLALSCTGEYATYFGGTTVLALAAMNNTMTRVNGIFCRDLAVKMEMIDKPEIIYLDATTDPYSAASVGANGIWTEELQANLTTVVGEENYEIGHLLGATGGGGNAGCIGCVCENGKKGSAFTSPADAKPEGDAFDVDFVAHEMGHQLGANHTFSYTLEGTDANVEPGSGSTIMGYAGITDYDVQSQSDDYFAFKSISQIQKNLATKPSTCPLTAVAIANATPVINITQKQYTIPKGTPFYLKGYATDADTGDALTFCWEQNNSATSANTGDKSTAYRSKTSGPMFRSFSPTTSKDRYFPEWERVLAGQLSSRWESVSDVSKTMKMVFTARDNALEVGQTASDSVSVTVGDTGPFEVKVNSWDNANWRPNSTQMITWQVNKTNTLAGADKVNIKLSTDGGLTFATVLASATPNDGEEIITVPNITAENCRFLIEPVNNIFYTINAKQIAIGYNPVDTATKYYLVSTKTTIPTSLSYLTKTIDVPQTDLKVADVNVTVKITHPSPSDLDFEIESPQNVVTKLYLNRCSGYSSSLTLVFDDAGASLKCDEATSQRVAPEDLLFKYNGTDPSGTWKFRIRDKYMQNSGSVDSAILEIVSKTYETLSIPNRELQEFVLSPNPNNGFFNVKFKSEGQEDVYVFVNDMLGRKIFENTYSRSLYFNQDILLDDVQSGVYLLTIIDGKRQETKKIIVKSNSN